MLVCYFVKIETVFSYRNSKNLLIHQNFLKRIFFYDNLNHFIVLAPYTSYNKCIPLAHDLIAEFQFMVDHR